MSNRVYEPLRLTCKDEERANACRVILTGMGATLVELDGTRYPPLTEGTVLVLPWGGRSRFVDFVCEFAMRAQVAEPDAIRDMQYAALAQDMGTDKDSIREFGEAVGDAVRALMVAVGTSSPPDIDGLMSTFDEEVYHLQPPPEE